LLLVAAAWWWRWRDRGHGLASASCLVTGLAILTWFSPSMLSGLTQFARMEDGVSWPTRLLVGTISALALGGFALPTVGLLGLVRRGPWTASRLGGTAFVVAFGLAALLTGQVKGNWALPGLLLLWPHGGPGWPRPVWTGLASVSLALTLITTAALVRPDWTGDLEARLPVLSRLYVEQAGAREARVSPTRSWAHRFGEYRGLEPFAEEVRKLAPQPLGWIVCDDYGLATQLSVALSRARIPVVLPQDPIFRRTVRQGEPARPADGILYVGVHRTPAELAAALDHPWPLRPLEALPHPVTGDPLQLATPTGATP
ncbi:MAG: hypothetical protein HKO53_09410, partial [Gemmatimonadetes bacterium]|nr:hypothetical protein [Gemmatimonadota bacterium]